MQSKQFAHSSRFDQRQLINFLPRAHQISCLARGAHARGAHARGASDSLVVEDELPLFDDPEELLAVFRVLGLKRRVPPEQNVRAGQGQKGPKGTVSGEKTETRQSSKQDATQAIDATKGGLKKGAVCVCVCLT